jgi:hypothetical protein
MLLGILAWLALTLFLGLALYFLGSKGWARLIGVSLSVVALIGTMIVGGPFMGAIY